MSATSLPPAAPVVGVRVKTQHETVRRLLRSATFVVGSSILLFWAVCALFGSRLTPQDPLAQSG